MKESMPKTRRCRSWGQKATPNITNLRSSIFMSSNGLPFMVIKGPEKKKARRKTATIDLAL
jgi:hypothetical protein